MNTNQVQPQNENEERRVQTMAYTVRLPVDVSDQLQEEARRTGLTVSDVLTLSLQLFFKMPSDPTIALLSELTQWAAKYGDDFPDDVIYRATKHIRDTPRLYQLFKAAITGEDGEVDKAARKLLLQKIGKCVKRAVNGEVYARSVRKTKPGDLVASFSLLRKKSSEDEFVVDAYE